MRDKILLAVFGIFLLACSEEELPAGIYDYQVERLLSAGSEKTWSEVVNSTNCVDSVKLHFEMVSNATNDSLDVFELIPISNCTSFDTTLIGRADASRLVGSDLFTDSLIFSTGSFWIVRGVTSQFMTVEVNGDLLSFKSTK
ncbi:hypothetical protein [Ekhidna sp.]|uniref:hypothetical protein n=1 Tax=Ekhidna sp. TaxID=2608089 RepID=UPI0035144F43